VYYHQISSGVLQVSELGPTLFLIFINDLPQVITCKVSLYADDTLIYAAVNSNEGKQLFQTNIDALHKWSMKWKMPFTTEKCEVIVFSKAPKAYPVFDPSYALGGTPLKCRQEIKYLGIILQSNLKFEQHITSKIKSASKVVGCIKYSLYEAPANSKLLAYTILCRPILEYGNTLWDPADSANIDALERVQSQAIRFINKIKGRQGISEAQNKLELQLLKDRRKTHRLSLLMRILSDESKHQTLASAYDELTKNKNKYTITINYVYASCTER